LKAKKTLSNCTFFIGVFIFLCINPIGFAQVWIDKNEDENYIARHELGFTQAGNKFYLFGGRESPQVVDIYDYATNSWSNGSLAPEEFNHFQAVTYQGLIWVIGAFKNNNNQEDAAAYVYMYNPALDQWIQGMEIPESRRRGASGLAVYNDTFYLLGGNTLGHNGGYVSYFDQYEPATGNWTILTDAPRPRDHFHSVIFNDKLYAIGGRLTGGSGGLFEPQVPEVDVYDFATSSWYTLDSSKNIPHPRAGLTACVFQDEIFTIGGESTFGSPTNTNGPRDVVEAFNPITETWSSKASLNYSRHGIQAITSGDGIHIVGGSSGTSIKKMEVYNTDNPTGTPNVSSEFFPDEFTKSFTYEENDGSVVIDITLFNINGTTGTYIDSITISGENFTLDQTYTNQLLGTDSTLPVQAILTNTTSLESNGLVTVTYNNNETFSIVLNGEMNTLSSSDFDKNDELHIFPSPTYRVFRLNKPVTSLYIYKLNGVLVKSFTGNFEAGHAFDMGNLNSGIYFISAIDSSNHTHLLKVVKQ